MQRLILILIGIFNIFSHFKMWMLPLHFILKPIQAHIFPPIGIISVGILFIFLLIQSIQLALFKKKAIRIQFLICIIDPFIRIFTAYKGINQFHESQYIPEIYLIVFGFIIIDIVIIFFLNSAKTKQAFGIEKSNKI